MGTSSALKPLARAPLTATRRVKTKRPAEGSVLQWAVDWPDSHTGCRSAISSSRGHPLALLRGSRETADAVHATANALVVSRATLSARERRRGKGFFGRGQHRDEHLSAATSTPTCHGRLRDTNEAGPAGDCVGDTGARLPLPPLRRGRLGASGSDGTTLQGPPSARVIPHWAFRIPQSSGTTTMERGSLVGERLSRQGTNNGSPRGGVPTRGEIYLDPEETAGSPVTQDKSYPGSVQ